MQVYVGSNDMEYLLSSGLLFLLLTCSVCSYTISTDEAMIDCGLLDRAPIVITLSICLPVSVHPQIFVCATVAKVLKLPYSDWVWGPPM